MLAEDIMNRCNHTARRWQEDTAFTHVSDDLARVTNNMRSVMTAVDNPTSKMAATILNIQAEASKTLSGITGLMEKELRSEQT